MPVKVVIADCQYLIRVGIKSLLSKSKEFEIIGEAVYSPDLIELVKVNQPDIIILDYQQPFHFSLKDIETCKSISPHTKFLIISMDENRDQIIQAIDYGAISFLTKECDEDEIINALRATTKNEKFMCHKVIDIILRKEHHQEEDCKPFNLSVREVEIIQQTAQGLSAKEIAEKLFLSTHTVYTHRKNIMKKLCLNSSSEMILYALKNGIVSSEEVY